MEQATAASAHQDQRKERRRRLLLALLLLLVLVTTSMVGYVLGRSASGPLGQVTDTVLLDPQNGSARTSTHLTGQVMYQDGTPAAGLKLELHSDPIVVDTDDRGVFLFPNVPFGDHRITVFGPDGSVAAEQPVSVVQSQDVQGVEITQDADGGSTITVAVNVRILEIAIQLKEGGALDIAATGYTYVDGDGRVTTPTGSASVASGVVVTPKGHICLPDGTIVIPRSGKNGAAVILPDDTVIYPERQLDGEGYAVKPDGTVVLPHGTEIRPGGIVVTPDGAQREPGAGGVIVVDGNVVTPIGGGSAYTGSGADSGITPGDTPTGGTGAEAPNTGGGTTPGGSTSPAGGTPSGTTPGGGTTPNTPPTGGNTPEVPDTPDTPDTPGVPDVPDTPPDGSLLVYGENRGGSLVQWAQSSTIDLFYNRTSGVQEKIAPGSSGYYRFQLQNTLSSKLNVKVLLREADLHLPLTFTLTPVDASGRKLSGRAVAGTLSTSGGLSLETDIAGKAVAGYRLDWVWPAEGNDALDTQIGSGANLTYLLSLTIHAEQA